MADDTRDIYHLVTQPEFTRNRRGATYTPSTFAADGFIHCSTRTSTLAVADDYFGSFDEALLLLEIDRSRLSSPVVFEAAAPIVGGGTDHLSTASTFPHVYGVLNLDAVSGVAVLKKQNGKFVWPEKWRTLDE
ncbi:MAG TPA: DUF952 domain-containing protein [Candidatus Acidoferrales bacterium]|nr:DUF952 domain-containing protein [Candidatus Acidoferrales bacterium]